MILDHWVVRDDGNRKIYIQFWDSDYHCFNRFAQAADKETLRYLRDAEMTEGWSFQTKYTNLAVKKNGMLALEMKRLFPGVRYFPVEFFQQLIGEYLEALEKMEADCLESYQSVKRNLADAEDTERRRSSYISKLVIYGPDGVVREAVTVLKSKCSSCCVKEEQWGESRRAYLAGMDWLDEIDAARQLEQLKWAAFVLNFSENALQMIASQAGSPTVDYRQTICTLFEEPEEWNVFLEACDPDYYLLNFRDILDIPDIADLKDNPQVKPFLETYATTEGISWEKTMFPDRIWYLKERYDGRDDQVPLHLPDWWSIDEMGKMEPRLFDRMTLPNHYLFVKCENAVLADLMKRHGFPEKTFVPAGMIFGDGNMCWNESGIELCARPTKATYELDYDDRDFYGLFSLDAVVASLLTCLKDILRGEVRVRLWREIPDPEAYRKAVEAAVVAFEADYLQHAGEILGAFVQLESEASYVTSTNDYYEIMAGFYFAGKLEETENGTQYKCWIKKR